jgi:hypothetical protein
LAVLLINVQQNQAVAQGTTMTVDEQAIAGLKTIVAAEAVMWVAEGRYGTLGDLVAAELIPPEMVDSKGPICYQVSLHPEDRYLAVAIILDDPRQKIWSVDQTGQIGELPIPDKDNAITIVEAERNAWVDRGEYVSLDELRSLELIHEQSPIFHGSIEYVVVISDNGQNYEALARIDDYVLWMAKSGETKDILGQIYRGMNDPGTRQSAAVIEQYFQDKAEWDARPDSEKDKDAKTRADLEARADAATYFYVQQLQLRIDLWGVDHAVGDTQYYPQHAGELTTSTGSDGRPYSPVGFYANPTTASNENQYDAVDVPVGEWSAGNFSYCPTSVNAQGQFCDYVLIGYTADPYGGRDINGDGVGDGILITLCSKTLDWEKWEMDHIDAFTP